jgi:class III poly(R)-hydroxyalkanoic acid synthase PhaE subunit
MDPFETMQSIAEFWGRSGQGYATAQQNLFKTLSENMAKAAGSPTGFTLPASAPDSDGLARANEAFSKLWSSAVDLSTSVTKSLPQGSERSSNIVAEMFGKIFDPRGFFAATSEMDEALQRMSEGPRLSDLWEVERKFLAVFNAWVAMRRRSVEHNTVTLDAWIRAAGLFAKALNAKAEKGEHLGSWREVMALWVDTANKVLLETQRSDAFLRSQRELLKASTELRFAQQELAEYYSNTFGYPTRQELDDVHKTVTELRRELRMLQRQLRQARPRPNNAGGKDERHVEPGPDQARGGDRRSGVAERKAGAGRQAVPRGPRRGRRDRDDAKG